MPTIAWFYGIAIQMFYNDHSPLHLHARKGVRDLSDVIAEGGVMVEPLKSKGYFDRVFVEMGAPTWPSGFDLDPINLYMGLRDAGSLTRTAAE